MFFNTCKLLIHVYMFRIDLKQKGEIFTKAKTSLPCIMRGYEVSKEIPKPFAIKIITPLHSLWCAYITTNKHHVRGFPLLPSVFCVRPFLFLLKGNQGVERGCKSFKIFHATILAIHI